MKRFGLWLAGGLFLVAPLGAGLTGAGYFAVIPFTALFTLWVLIMRTTPFADGPAFFLPAVMIHAAIASTLLGLGLMLRALSGASATLPLTAWLALGLVALALGRLLWRPDKTVEIEAYLEAALKRLNDGANDPEDVPAPALDLTLSHPTEAEATALAAAYAMLDALPAEAPGEAALRAILDPLDGDVRSHILLPALLHRAARTATGRDRFAALIAAADGGHAWRQIDEARMAEAFELIVTSADTATLAQFLRLGNVLLDDFPTTAAGFPPVPRLLDIARQIAPGHPDLSDGLVALASRLEDLNETLIHHD
ncbi:hypothetical protein [Tropicimonas sp. IMCC34043]|uniref:hypothetical protein n=1 Tax=Tropicimonas sp. IMCC34043 TaxID=2248760 RepID=UPI000E275951|nr:hypothetical protein [Tropicimonas sp. IMCC34043]